MNEQPKPYALRTANGVYDPELNRIKARYGQDQTTVAGAGPARAGGATGDWGDAGPNAGRGSRGNGPRPDVGYVEGLRLGLPDTSAVIAGTHADVANSLGKGRYAGAVVKGLRGSLAMVPAVLNDTVGAGLRSLRNPVEDAGRAALGLEDRKEPAAAAAAAPAQPEVLTPPPTTVPAPQPEQPALLQGPTEADMAAQRRVDRDAQTLRDTALGDRMEATRMAREAAGYAAQAQPQYLGKQWAADKDAWNASVKSTVGGDGLSARQRRQFNIQDQQVAATLRGQDLSADTSLRTNENTNATTLRGQDMDYQGKRAEVAGASARAQQEQLNKDRTYQLDVARFGVETANKNRDDTRAAEKAFSDRVSGLVGDDKDGVKAAAIRSSANAWLDKMRGEAQEALKKEPGNKSALARLEKIDREGVSLMDESELRDLVINQEADRVAGEEAGWAPWSGKRANTTDPVKKITKKNTLWFDQYEADNGHIYPEQALRDNPNLQRFMNEADRKKL